MIKTLIFDFGDVFINLDKPATLRRLKDLNIDGFTPDTVEKNLELETGRISSEEFLNHYLEEYPQLDKEKAVEAWNAVLVDLPEYRFRFIKKLAEQGKYQLILLSNTNAIHIDWVKKNVPFFDDFRKCFDAFYLSHEINFRKPNVDIYNYVLEKHHLIAAECLFIDDTEENIEGAKKAGLRTWKLEPTHEDVIDLFTTKKELF
ncbi:MAG: HAD family phosphatase [Salegentibacter sp.]